jgi:intracellular sulfur oxidation DsrE/DsrF family protein
MISSNPLRALPVMALFVLSPAALLAQAAGPSYGPYINSAGPVFEIPDPDFATPVDMTFQIAFDLAVGSEGPDDLNQGLNSVARFLNMHGAAGVPRDRLQVAVVIHGTAAKDFLNAAAFQDFAGYRNPNLELIEELAAFGVRFVMCGQSLSARGVPRGELVEPVEVALSAMTAHLVLQAEGYRVNPF